MKEVSKTVSTTMVVGGLMVIYQIYQALAPVQGWPQISFNSVQIDAFAQVLAPVLGTVYMMWRRAKKSVLKWGMFK